ncbi:hypothetical protein Bca52824_026488 [Brassica carinata]|uniref:Uncharacterized protein n=1 Tax=Brassica carinata TaxID=52824 RepID=A0A8X7SHS5_BRACI|nr:hypothetical protein Bca52824_026488 [Brassica carinata]
MKTFIEDLFTSSFNSFKELVQKDFHDRFDKVTNEVGQLKEQVSQNMGPSDTVGKGSASEIQCPSATFGKDQGNSSHSPAPSAAKVKGKAAANVDPTLLDEIERMAEHQARLDEEIEDLRISMKKTVQEEVMNHNNVGCVGTLFGLLCLWSKYD